MKLVEEFTLTSYERIVTLCRAVRYVVESGVPGDIVECGVWRGGSMMAVARTLKRMGHSEKELYLFDTFEGMTRPSEFDISFRNEFPLAEWESAEARKKAKWICDSPYDDVCRAVGSIGYDPEKIHFVKGRVEDTIPAHAPDQISLLRLDTDWYESTKHELEHLFPRLTRGGVLIIDDYGHWQGARRATDEYFNSQRISMLLNRIDYTARIGVRM